MPAPRAQVASRYPDCLQANASLPGHPRDPTSLSPSARGVLGRCRSRSALSLPCAVPPSALCERLAPVLRIATMQPALFAPRRNLKRCPSRVPSRKPLPRFSVGKRFAARPPAVAPRLPRLLPAASPALTCAAVEACRVLCHIARFARASLRDDAARTLAPRCGVNRCPAACPIRKPLPRSLAGLRFVARPPAVAPRLSRLSPASSPALPCTWRSKPAARRATSRASHTARSGLVVCDDAARTLAPRRNVQRCPRSVPNAQTALLILCLRTIRYPAARLGCTPFCTPVGALPLRRSKLAVRCATSRAPRSGLDDAARTRAPRRDVQRSSCRVPSSQTAFLFSAGKRFFASSPPWPRVFLARR